MTEHVLWLETLGIGMAIIGLTAATARAQYPPLSAEEIATVEREVTAAVHTYYQLFSSRDAKGVGERVFHMPWILLDPDGAKVYSSAEETKALFESSLAQILPQGWERGTFYRYKKDGSVLSEHGVTYVFGRTPDGWRIASLASHPPGRGIECQD